MAETSGKIVQLTIDARSVETRTGTTVLKAALDSGIYIPNLCYLEGLSSYGSCRLCLVEIEGLRGLQTACTTSVEDGMVVRTDTKEINEIRLTIIEMLLADHPSDCLVCPANMRCEVQRIANHVGLDASRYRRQPGAFQLDESNPFFVRDLSRCVLCGRCVRICHDLRGVGSVDFAFRGDETRVVTSGAEAIADSSCESCGACVDACPTGALRPKFENLPPAREVATICPYCGCGCGLVLGLRERRIVGVRGDKSNLGSRGDLCVKGRFGLDFVGSPERLMTPLVRRDGKLQPTNWDDALSIVANRFKAIKAEHGADAVAGLSSAKCTNEENYLFQKFIRVCMGTNNIDHCARLCHASTVAGLERAFGSGAMTNSYNELENSGCIFVIGSNTTEAHPIIALRIKRAVERHGARLVVADPRRIDLVRFADVHLQQRPGTDVMLVNAMMNTIVADGLQDIEFIKSRTEGFEEAWKAMAPCTPEVAAVVAGVPVEEIRRAAHMFAEAERASIVYSMGITQHTTGTENVLALANLAMITGNVGKESAGVNPLRGQNNVQGACDLGALPNVYPSYQKVDDHAVQEKFEKAWGARLSDRPGLTVVEMIHGIEEGRVKAFYVMGENPALSDPNICRTRKALVNCGFLVVQDVFLTETAELADVVLPGAVFCEKDGTFTSTERRIQRVRKVLDPPGSARPDWEVICDLARRCGYEMKYSSPSAIMDEIALVTPIYGGMKYERIGEGGLQWPCPTKDHPGTPYLHKGKFSRGLGKFHATPFKEAAELRDDEYPFILSTGRVLYHFHTGTLSRRCKGLEEIAGPVVEVNPEDAAVLGVEDGEFVEVVSRRGRVRTRALVTMGVKRGVVFMPFHFREAAANILTNDALDPIAKIPEFKVCAAKIVRLETRSGTRHEPPDCAGSIGNALSPAHPVCSTHFET